MSDTATPAARPSRRWPLYLSLFLNVVLLTALGFFVARVMEWRDGPMGMGPWMPGQVENALPEDARAKVREIRKAHADELKPLFDNVRTAREGIRTAMDAEPFSADGLSAALAAMRRADQAVAEVTAKVIVEMASALTPDERRQVRDNFRDRMKERRHGKDRGGDRDCPGPGDGPPPPDGALPPPPPGEAPPPPPQP
ncbi:MAG: periplasmic heavy metal sensor [Alphaproteobacteria bacterium]|nr:periplasmic heavy metal sensor [Alphaproteobacteria bacterium]